MHFRVREKVVQVVRTTYDSTTKKPKTEVVGRINRAKPAIDAELADRCSPAELAEIRHWIDHQGDLSRLIAEVDARTLPEKMQQAADWLVSHQDHPLAASVADEIAACLPALRRAVATFARD
jgi:hypothetical protein